MFKTINEIAQYKEQIKQSIRDITNPAKDLQSVSLDIKEINKKLKISLMEFDKDDKTIKFHLISESSTQGFNEVRLLTSELIGFFSDLNFFATGEIMEGSVDNCYKFIFIKCVTKLIENSIYVSHGNFKGDLFLDFLKSGVLKGLQIKSTAKTVEYTITNNHGIVVWKTTMSNKTGSDHFNVDTGYFNNILVTALTITLLYNEDNWDVVIPSYPNISLS